VVDYLATKAEPGLMAKWLLELLGLPEDSAVVFATGATMANFAGLAAALWRRMADAGWDLDGDGLAVAAVRDALAAVHGHPV